MYILLHHNMYTLQCSMCMQLAGSTHTLPLTAGSRCSSTSGSSRAYSSPRALSRESPPILASILTSLSPRLVSCSLQPGGVAHNHPPSPSLYPYSPAPLPPTANRLPRVHLSVTHHRPLTAGSRCSSTSGSSRAYSSPRALSSESPPIFASVLYSLSPWRVSQILRPCPAVMPALHT